MGLIIFIVGGYVFFMYSPLFRTAASNLPPSIVLQNESKEYSAAVQYENEGKYDLALEAYQRSLADVKDPRRKNQIRFNIARAQEETGDYKSAIAGFKAIADDASAVANIRAFSIEEIVYMHYSYFTPEARATIDAEVFQGEPYDSFQKGNKTNVAYTKLLEYGTGIYPLPYSEARLARNYSTTLVDDLGGATTTPQGKAYVTLIKKSVELADAGLPNVRVLNNKAAYSQRVLSQEGVALGNLASLGVIDAKDAEKYFIEGLSYNTASRSLPGNSFAYNYASFLLTAYGKSRINDIKTMLAPFKVGNEAEITKSASDLFKVARTDSSLSKDRKKIIHLAQVDGDFEKYLISLGWEQADFAN